MMNHTFPCKQLQIPFAHFYLRNPLPPFLSTSERREEMIKQQINMELIARIFLVVSISSLILYLSVEGLNILPSLAQPNSRVDEVNQLAKDQGWPDVGQAKEASQPSLVPVSSLDEAKEAPGSVSPTAPSFGPVSSKEAPGSVSPTALDGPKQVLDPISSSPVSNQGKEAPSPTSLWGGMSMSSVLDEARKKFAPMTSVMVNEAESVLSPSILGLGKGASSPVPSPLSGGAEEATTAKGGEAPLSGGEAAMAVSYPNSPSPSIALIPAPSPSGFMDHDIALAIESRIKQSQTDSQLAMDEARKLLSDPNMASSETGKCLSKCVDKYAASLNELNRAIMDLGVRDVTLLADDFGAVETDISSCQACFSENIGEDSPLKALEEATTKAARECLTVMDYAS